jgi:hypothetical protein
MPKKQQRILADPFAGQNAGQHQIHDCYAVMRTTCQDPPKRNSADAGYENHGAGQNGGTMVDVYEPIPPDEGIIKPEYHTMIPHCGIFGNKKSRGGSSGGRVAPCMQIHPNRQDTCPIFQLKIGYYNRITIGVHL